MPNEFDRHIPDGQRDGAAFLTVRDLAQALRIGRNQAYALVRRGEIASCRVGASIRIPRAALDRLNGTEGSS